MRFVAAWGLGLTPLLASAAAGTVPAFAGGGAGLTLTATMEGQDQRLLVGTQHLVTITVADTPGESDLRDITVGLDDLDPHPLPVTCPAGVDGRLSLEPGQSLQCTATVTAEVGYRTLLAKASAHVPGGEDLVRSVPLHYTGFLPPPPPPPPPAPGPAAAAPMMHAALKEPLTSEPAAARPHPGLAAPPPPAVAPPLADAGDSGNAGDLAAAPREAGACDNSAGGDVPRAASTCCVDGKAGVSAKPCCGKVAAAAAAAGPDCAKLALAAAGGGHKNGFLAFTGLSGPMLAAIGAAGLALITGGVLFVRRGARR
ncbi:hypothetical protein GCM10009839_83760 [Catenulispora yoronensis]|uniref:Gram-positive cocci surface proteins LPxTG domain-containing protein n=1 Tax=Catenulispora yoronensis TaxID=450799 RepID=A0ABP5GY25_9ACTN